MKVMKMFEQMTEEKYFVVSGEDKINYSEVLSNGNGNIKENKKRSKRRIKRE